jgi:hypothetical protein
MAGSAYRAGMGVPILAAFLTVWTTIVRDDGDGAAYFMVILAVGVGWFSASFRPAGMARAMLGVATMQVCLGTLVATAPVTENMPGGVPKAMLFHAVFTALWLLSAGFFRASSKKEQEAPSARSDVSAFHPK